MWPIFEIYTIPIVNIMVGGITLGVPYFIYESFKHYPKRAIKATIVSIPMVLVGGVGWKIIDDIVTLSNHWIAILVRDYIILGCIPLSLSIIIIPFLDLEDKKWK